MLWAENDYSVRSTNQVVSIVDTNYGKGVHSKTHYNYFSLLKTLKAGFGVPCLNHAFDQNSNNVGPFNH